MDAQNKLRKNSDSRGSLCRVWYDAATVREICSRAGANIAAVNYHFGDKRNLYASIFDRVFEAVRAYRTPFLPRSEPPEQRLAIYVRAFFEELYYCEEDQREAGDIAAIYLMEMARPTEALDHIVQAYIAADAEELQDIVTAMLGPDAEPEVVLNCASSIAGQVLYYYHAQPLIARLHPEVPAIRERVDALVDHVVRFSLAGVSSFKQGSNG
ncbi:CerR family C-terminal domain-containing protein [Candidatus Reidiella endopervernicosa]|uniref:CerR family C-terminal domain-containing protein n=1 Tax=Candidatus Reidiella endopervernicosa TaxID=2738883 RepID=UPI0023511B0F|nr:CerR family C-terminal domain-containing protein [Candidatus Reidiella endopervernicosa]